MISGTACEIIEDKNIGLYDYVVIRQRPPRSTRTVTRFPNTTRFRAVTARLGVTACGTDPQRLRALVAQVASAYSAYDDASGGGLRAGPAGRTDGRGREIGRAHV